MKNEGCAELLTNETTGHGGRQPSLLSPNLAYCGTRVFPQNLIHLVNPPRNKGSMTATPPPLPETRGTGKEQQHAVFIFCTRQMHFAALCTKDSFGDFSDLVIVISTL